MDLTPEILLRAYAMGVFPMAEHRDDPEVFWVDPKRRGILPLDAFHVSRSLAKTLRRDRFRITVDRAFRETVAACADRDETWINDTIFDLYGQLHDMGHAHSLEVWDGPDLVGGVYGVVRGGAFFGESMFSHRTDASKVALAYLVSKLLGDGFVLFDTQFVTPHLRSLGAMELGRGDYRSLLGRALTVRATFKVDAPIPTAQEVLQRINHTS